jgi:hypothetical protein
MMGQVISHQPQSHVCQPGWEEYEADLPGMGRKTCLRTIPDPGDGAVWECECGRTWVCYHDTMPRRGRVFLGALWRPEKRREWRRRLRLIDGTTATNEGGKCK